MVVLIPYVPKKLFVNIFTITVIGYWIIHFYYFHLPRLFKSALILFFTNKLNLQIKVEVKSYSLTTSLS